MAVSSSTNEAWMAKELPNSSIREGFRDIHLGAPGGKHPVEILQKQKLRKEEEDRMKRAAAVYGLHAPLRMRMERELLCQSQRLPGIRSSLLGLQTVMGLDDTIEFEDFLNVEVPEDPNLNRSMHDLLEARMGLN